MEVWSCIKQYKYHIFIAANLLWIWALLSPNIYYFDDSYRASGGFYNWGGDFRPFADWLYYILGLGQRFTDITPLPQIFALFFIYTTYNLFIRNFNYNEQAFSNLLIFFPIVWSPFLLSNLYFRYDSIFMMLAILLSVVSVFYVDKKKYIFAAIFLFIACGLYQPAIVAYMCTVFFTIYNIRNESKNKIFIIWIKQSLIYSCIFLIVIIFYYFTIMKHTNFYNSYSATHTQMSVSNLIPNVVQSIRVLYSIFQGDTGILYLFVILYLILINLIYFIKKSSYWGVILFILTHLGFILSATGVNLLLDVPRFEYRTFIFYGFYVSFLLLSFFNFFKDSKYEKYILIIPYFIAYYFLSIALNVSNAQKIQSSFEDLLVFDISNSISSKNIDINKVFLFVGNSHPSNIDVLSDKYPIIEKTVTHQVHFSFKIKKYFPVGMKIFTFNDLDKENKFLNIKKNDLILIESKKFFKIYEVSNENKIIIYLNKVES